MLPNIETNIPIPPKKSGGCTDAIRKLAESPVGSSVLLTGIKPNSVGTLAKAAGLAGCYSARKADGGVRVWKTAEPGVGV